MSKESRDDGIVERMGRQPWWQFYSLNAATFVVCALMFGSMEWEIPALGATVRVMSWAAFGFSLCAALVAFSARCEYEDTADLRSEIARLEEELHNRSPHHRACSLFWGGLGCNCGVSPNPATSTTVQISLDASAPQAGINAACRAVAALENAAQSPKVSP